MDESLRNKAQRVLRVLDTGVLEMTRRIQDRSRQKYLQRDANVYRGRVTGTQCFPKGCGPASRERTTPRLHHDAIFRG